MSKSSQLVSSLLIACLVPRVINILESLVDGQEMKSEIGDDLLLQSISVCLIVDSVLEPQSGNFSISIKTSLHRLWKIVPELFSLILDLLNG